MWGGGVWGGGGEVWSVAVGCGGGGEVVCGVWGGGEEGVSEWSEW